MSTDAPGEAFKAGFRRHAAGVAVVATTTARGPVGATLSSVASVSVDPPTLSFSVSTSGRSGPVLAAAERVAVHVLSAAQAPLAAAFADRAADRFTAEQGWVLRDDAPPALPGAAASFTGRVVRTVPVGGATLVLVEVDDVALGEHTSPLVHLDRRYRTVGATLEVAPAPGGAAGGSRSAAS